MHTLLLLRKISCMSSFVSLADKSSEGESCGLAAGKDELEVVHSWLVVVGVLALDEKEVQGLLCEVLVLIQYHSTFITKLLLFYNGV